MTTQRTYMAKAGEVPSRWFLVDARGQTLGRLSVNIARVLRGKHRPQFTPQGLTPGVHQEPARGDLARLGHVGPLGGHWSPPDGDG